MKKTITLLFSLFIFSCSESKNEVEKINCSISNIGNTAVQVILNEPLPVDYDYIVMYENEQVVKKIPFQIFSKGDTIVLNHNLKDSTDYNIAAVPKSFGTNNSLYFLSSKFWYSKQGDSIIHTPPYSTKKKKVVM